METGEQNVKGKLVRNGISAHGEMKNNETESFDVDG